MNVLLHPTYFPNVAGIAVVAQNSVCWEVHDNYQKQTYRNRCYICTDRGRHMLNIPIKHVGGNQGRQKYKDVQLENDYNWQKQHWRTLQTAYRTSPFFEFYEDELSPLFEKPFKFLMDLNFETISFLCKSLGIDLSEKKSERYEVSTENNTDARFLVNAKQEVDILQEPYFQVFGDRHGFIKNTSALDTLFNLGPNALEYFTKQPLNFLNA